VSDWRCPRIPDIVSSMANLAESLLSRRDASMDAEDFRRIALSLEGAEEGDFVVALPGLQQTAVVPRIVGYPST
jgi:hypothetical protein